MTRRGVVAAVAVLAITMAACTPSGRRSSSATNSGKRAVRIVVHDAKSYDSISSLLVDTKVAVIATAESLRPDPSSRRDSLVRMKVSKVLRGHPGRQITVSEAGGQPGEVVKGQVPIRSGHTYLMLLGIDGKSKHYFVLNGVTGLFRYDTTTQTVTRLDPTATFMPRSFSLNLAEAQLGTPPPPNPTPLTSPPLAGTCPPGCSLPSDDDAITVLASSATLVEVVTVTGISGAGPSATARVSTNLTLQEDPHQLAIGGLPEGAIPRLLVDWTKVVVGQSYLIFASFDRGGACVSALFTYDPGTKLGQLVGSADGLNNHILLPGRSLDVPQSISLAEVQERMDPTGGVLYPTDASESYCPGP